MAFTLQPVVTAQDVEQTAQMADAIWHEYFTPIIGAEQVAYMLEKFQCVAAMQRQISQENMQYFRLMRDGVMVGYTGIREEPDALFLSKLYLAKEYRGQGLARQTLNALVQRCRRQGLSKIWLTVNRYNAPTIAAYKAMVMFAGVRERLESADIGGGFYMDDFIMEKPIDIDET